MAVKFANNVSTTLSSAINASQTTISVTDASGLPALSSGDYVYLTLDSNDSSPTLEVVKVTAISSNSLTVVRGRDGTTASSFSSGAKVELRITAAGLDDISSQAQSAAELAADNESVSKDGDTMTGDLTLGDNNKLILGGSSNNLEIYNDGSNSIIKETAAGSLMLRASGINLQNTSNANLLSAVSGGAVKLYNNGALRFQTTATGADVPGAITAYSATISNANPSTTMLTLGSSSQTGYTLQDWRTSSHGATEAYIIAYGASHSTEAGNFAIKNIEANSDIFFELASSVVPLRLTSSGATFAGSISASEQSVFTGNAISGTPNSNAQIVAADSGVAGIAIHSNDGGQGYLWFGDNTNNAVGRIYYNHATDKVHWRVGGTNDAHTLDSSGNATFAGHISLPDSKYLRLGADNDFIIYHDGATNYIQTVKQDSDLIIRGNDGGTNFNALTIDMSAGGNATFAGTISSGAITSSASVIASGNSNSFGNTTISALTVTSVTASGSITASGNSNSFGNTTVGTLTSGAITSTGNMSLSNSNAGNNITINRTDVSNSAIFHIGSSRGYIGTTSNTLFEIRQNNVAAIVVDTSGNTTIENNLVVDGNLTVSGTTTTLNTATLDVEDKNITLNYSTGDSSASADGAGITIQDAVNSTTDATILWDATNDEFDFSHAVNINGKITGNNEFRLDNGTGGTTHFNYQDGGSNYIRGTTTYIDTLLDLNSNNITDVGTISSGAITTTGDISLNKADGFVYLNNVGTGNSGIYVRGITSSNTLRSHTTDNFRWEVSGSQKMELDSAGRLKIGTTSTTPAFSTGNGHVFHVGDASHISRNGGVALVVNRAGSNGEAVQVRRDGTHVGGLGIAGGANLTVNSAGSGGYGRLQDNGSDVAIWWTNGFYPASDNAKDLGVSSSSGRWRRLYMADAIWMNGSKIVDANRNLTNILGLYGNGGTLNHYNTNHVFKSTTSNLQAQITDTGIGVGTSPSAVGAGNTTAGLGLFSDGRIYASKSGNTVMSLNRNTSNGVIAEFRYAGNTIGNLGVEGGDSLFIQSDGSTGGGLRFHQNGVISPVRNGAVVDNTIDLGTSSQQFRELYLGSGLFMSGTQVIDSSRNADFAQINTTNHIFIPVAKNLYFGGGSHTYIGEDIDDRLRFFTGGAEFLRFTEGTTNETLFLQKIQHSITNIDNAFNMTFTDSDPDNSRTAMRIDYNASGNAALTGDRTHVAFEVDYDVTSTGGDTSNEYRAYGIQSDLRGTGDTDLRRGIYSYTETQHSAGTVSEQAAVYGYAVADDTGTGRTSQNYGGVFLATENGTGSGGTCTHYGVYARAHANSAADKNIAALYGAWIEARYDTTGTTTSISNVYGIRSRVYANSTDTNVTTSYIYYGEYTGTPNATNAYGIYIATNVENRFGGNIRADQGYKVGSTEIVDASRNIKNVPTVLVDTGSNDTSSSMGGQTPKLYVNGYTSLGGLRINGADGGNTIYRTGSDLSIIVGSANNLKLGTGGGERVRVDNSGYLRLGGTATNTTQKISSVTSTSTSGGSGTGNRLQLEFMETSNPGYGAKVVEFGVRGGGYVNMRYPGSAGLYTYSPYNDNDYIHIGYAGISLVNSHGGYTTNEDLLLRSVNGITFQGGGTTNSFRISASGTLEIGSSNTAILTQSRNLQNIASLTAGTINASGEFKSTSQSSNAVKTRFIAGAAAGSTSDGPLYLQYGKNQDIRMFEASGANRKLYIYGNDGGTDRWGGLSVGTDGSFTVQASDTYLILQAASYVQSNNPHNFTSTVLMSGTTVIDSGSFRGRNYIRHKNSGNVVMAMNDDTYTMLRNPLGETRIWIGSTGYNGASSDNNNYYNGSTHFFRDTSSNQVLTVNSTATDVKANLRVNGTTVITSARVLQSVTANASIITAGTLSNDRINKITLGSTLFNNKGQNHTTIQNFNTAMSPGPNYLQGYTNGPENTGQWYGFMLGLGADYGTTTGSSGHYASQMYYKRNASNNANYLYMRSMENGTWQSWLKVTAGAADKWTTARTLSLTGDATGSVSWDGSANASITVAVGDADTVDSLHASSFIRSDANDNVTGHTEWQDNYQVRLGNGADFRMYFDAADTIFRNYAHTNGDILFQGEDSNGSNRALVYMKTDSSAAYVQLFCVGNEKLRTVSTGVNIYGDLTATGNVTAYSDIRKKTNIQPLEGGLDIVKALEPKRFDWIESGKGSLGFIAQEVEEYLPELVDTEVNEIVELDDNQKPVTTGEEEVKSLDYGKMVSVLWAAVKEQSAQIETLNKRIEELENGNH
jgi:hypothetical protein